MNRIFAFLLAMFLIAGTCFGCAKDEPIVETEPATTEMVIEEEIPRVEITEPETEPEEQVKVETKPVKKPAATKPTTPKPKPTPAPEPETTAPPTTTPPETTEPPVVEPEETTPPVEEDKEESNKVSLGRFRLTAYCGCRACNGKWAGQTSTGVKPKQGRTIAVDPKVIPYGSKVMINGHVYTAEDCGGGIKGNRIDIYFDSHSECNQFGVQYADVYLIK